MMGERREMQEALFYGFSLERHVPDNHMLRKIDRFVDLSGVRAHLEPYYSEVGRPSIDPELMIRMLIRFCLRCLSVLTSFVGGEQGVSSPARDRLTNVATLSISSSKAKSPRSSMT